MCCRSCDPKNQSPEESSSNNDFGQLAPGTFGASQPAFAGVNMHSRSWVGAPEYSTVDHHWEEQGWAAASSNTQGDECYGWQKGGGQEGGAVNASK